MAKVTVSGFPKLQRRFAKLRGSFDKQTLDEVGRDIKVAIQLSTRKGKSLVTGKPFAPLKPSTVAFRRRYDGLKGIDFRPKKSNLTLSGQMIESLSYRTNVQTNTVTVEPTGQRFTTRSGERRYTNKRVAKFAHDGSSNRRKRPFIPISRLPKRLLQSIKRTLLIGMKRALNS